MRVMMLHNRYRQRGGEDAVAAAEAHLLREYGHEVIEVGFDNEPERNGLVPASLKMAMNSAWSQETYDRVAQLCREHRPDVAHVHNFWLRMTPSAHSACRANGVATVQTIHNFRLLCPNAQFLRDGKICEDCLGKNPWRGVVHRCYNKSLPQSIAVARMLMVNRERGTWKKDVNAFVALTGHLRQKLIEGDIPAETILIKANFVEDTNPPSNRPSESNTIAFISRLSQEKGVHNLIAAWAQAGLQNAGKLLIVGDGPEREALQRQAQGLGLAASQVTFVGLKPAAEARAILASVRAMVLPSIWYEGCPMIVIESLAAGRPAVVSDLGGLGEFVENDRNGFRVPAGDVNALGTALRKILEDGARADRYGEQARGIYETRHTPERNYEMLMDIYRFARENAARAQQG